VVLSSLLPRLEPFEARPARLQETVSGVTAVALVINYHTGKETTLPAKDRCGPRNRRTLSCVSVAP
jgi:hypothetical protein